ncbi:beta-lactamase family protein [Mangrovimonas sp. AS39]|uniref:serine hydrolase domain-containing protein n=1 Tax=Mangrovimonas futianensis TaxID=2895523 RepID=UPI001E5BA231|nr:serine hydrolase domain-containing protein [Mangrovimonas futianensis]MCF1192101.1 beta-lactamase family protein [Mangrovimonas futianensis]MCF1195795.1 beta-lactamase family protein [Mangrovimonas futianensis]
MKHILFIFFIIFSVSCQDKKNDKSASQIETTTDLADKSFIKKLDSLYNIGIFKGFSAAVVDTTGILYNQGFGYADLGNKKKFTENTIINIASISKVFVGIALLKAEELSLIDLDDPINKYLPFEVVNPNFPNEPIMVRQLATHSSSLIDTDMYMQTDYINKDDVDIAENLKEKYGLYYQNPSEDWIPLSQYLEKLLDKGGALYDASTFANRKPGEVYEYSNIGTALCALVIEYASKQPFNEFTEEYIFSPLDMSSTGWFFEEVDRAKYSKLYYDDQVLPYYKILSYPDGGLITSSTDLSKFLVELIKGYSGKGTILNTDSYNEFFKSQLKEKAFKKANYNVGIFIEKELTYHEIGHTGGDPGTNTLMYFNTETKKGKILILNTDSNKENSMDVYWGIWKTLDEF